VRFSPWIYTHVIFKISIDPLLYLLRIIPESQVFTTQSSTIKVDNVMRRFVLGPTAGGATTVEANSSFEAYSTIQVVKLAAVDCKFLGFFGSLWRSSAISMRVGGNKILVCEWSGL
jgi:hypothetical protein